MSTIAGNGNVVRRCSTEYGWAVADSFPMTAPSRCLAISDLQATVVTMGRGRTEPIARAYPDTCDLR